MNLAKKLVYLWLLFFSPLCAFQYTVEQKQLENGLTVLVAPVQTLQKVSMQLIYPVGSKHEDLSEKGLAHLIEHMIFKGTEKLSESDIPFITHELSGSCNAFTSFDTTRYLFNMPPQYWKEALPIMADCMQNCTFKDELLNSELKTVIEELKIYNDNYERTLMQKFITAIFAGHPYHYPVIGFKHDLWNLTRERLAQFYKTHYVPNNATLVIVGDVDPQEAFTLVEKHFGSIKKHDHYKIIPTHLVQDIYSQSITLYRDVLSPYIIIGYVIPGFSAKQHHLLGIIHSLLAGGKTTRLHQKLIDELQLVTTIGSNSIGLFDYDLFLISFRPKKQEDVDTIIDLISQELDQIAMNGFTSDEINKITKQIKSEQHDLFENNEEQATLIAQVFTALGEWEYAFKDHCQDHEKLNNDIKEYMKTYIRKPIMHKAFLLPITQTEKKEWLLLQEKSDEEDTAVLSGKIRISQVEPPCYASSLKLENPQLPHYPAPQQFTLSNGLLVSYHYRPIVKKIVAHLELKASGKYDSIELPGLYRIMCSMLTEGGTKNYAAQEIAHEFESNAINFGFAPGYLHLDMLSEDFEKALILSTELLTQPLFDDAALEKIKAWALHDYQKFITNPLSVAYRLIKKEFYKNHPKGKSLLGTPESIKAITQKDVIEFYQKNITPHGAHLAIVGDLSHYNIEEMLENTLGSWHGPEPRLLEPVRIEPITSKTITQQMHRDQIVLCFAGFSVGRLHPDFDKLLLFDTIFGSDMNSRLFNLREQTGAFYQIDGTLLSYVDEDLGLWTITTHVSKDRLSESEDLIKKTIETVADTMTEAELITAKRTVLLGANDNFSTNNNIANAFLFLKRYNLPHDFFTKRPETLEKITLEQVKEAVKKILHKDNMIIIKIGRV